MLVQHGLVVLEVRGEQSRVLLYHGLCNPLDIVRSYTSHTVSKPGRGMKRFKGFPSHPSYMSENTADIREKALAQTQAALEAETVDDQVLIQKIRAVDELEEIANTVKERVKAWNQYGSDDLLDALSAVQEEVVDCQDRLEQDCIDSAEALMPNLHAVVGDLLDCRLLSLAGSLEDLAKMPSSTIQVLGAEKAMFRYLKGQGKMPKHGVLYLHPNVHSLPEKKRGKMARFIANKAALAAKLDFYNGDFKGDEYVEEVEERFQQLKKT